MSKSRKLRAGVIGLRMGRGHVRAYQQNKHVELAAICDVAPQRLQEVQAEFQVPLGFNDASAMFSEAELDLVSVCTPNAWHEPLSVAALRAGLHVLCTKPMAMNTAGARRMVRAAKRSRKTLMIGFQLPMTRMGQAIKGMLDQGKLGQIYFVHASYLRNHCELGPGFFYKKNSGGGPLIDLGVHLLDFVLWLLGDPKVIRVNGSTYDHLMRASGDGRDVEDLARVHLRLADGCTVQIEVSFMMHRAPGEARIIALYGTGGGLSFDPWGTEASYFSPKVKGGIRTFPLPKETRGQEVSVNHFIECVRKRCKPIASPERGLYVLRIIEAAYRSAGLGRELGVD